MSCLPILHFCPKQSSVLPLKKNRLFSTSLVMYLPMMRQRTSPTPIGGAPDFFNEGINLHALYASRVFSNILPVAKKSIVGYHFCYVCCNFFETSEKSSPHICVQRDGPWLPCVLEASFLISSAPMCSKIALGYSTGLNQSFFCQLCN